MGKVRKYEGKGCFPYNFYSKVWLTRLRLKRVVKGQIWYYDAYTQLYRTELKDIQLNRKQRQSVKNRCKL